MENFHYDVKDALPVPRPFSARNAPHLREQVELGNFCLKGDRQYVCDKSRMMYLIEPQSYENVNWDLNMAFESRIRKMSNLGEKIDHLLRWIMDNVEKFRAPCDREKLSNLHTDFVCYRGLLTAIMCSVFENKESWIMGVTKYRGSIYMCQYDTAEKIHREKFQPERLIRASGWGYKFEQFLTAPKPGGRPTPEEPNNEKEEYVSVVRTRLGESHSLLFGAEIDAVDPKVLQKKPHLKHSTRRYVEMKTSRRIDNDRQNETFLRYKTIKWWAQSYLIGIPRVICGFRNDDGIVERLESYPLGTLAHLGKRFWRQEDSVQFLHTFLHFVKKHAVDDRITLFEFMPSSHKIKCMLLPEHSHEFSQLRILPPWYTDFMDGVLE
ncbi:decapping and exoribonuclease protein [Galendromus occidentalis]|uniref:Decapping nuclease n=1 Tax=Galendromus occidentalis TaxID=34638 RepID=A0AAJ6VV84_9ACAR|nr:decapping and exoribonuclease protein [Galendromus occidentalis]